MILVDLNTTFESIDIAYKYYNTFNTMNKINTNKHEYGK